MNDRLEAFRKRLRGPDREKTNWQFWIGSPTAWLALFLSSTTAFYTFLYHSDELRVAIIPGDVQLVPGKVRVEPPERFTFINSGSRPIAVLAADISVNQPDKGVPYPDCISGVGAPLFLKLEETVVKPYDAVVKSTKLEPGESPEIELSDANKSLSEPLFVLCVTFKFVATERAGSTQDEFVLLHNDRWSSDVEGFGRILAQGQSVLVCQHAHPGHRKPRNQSGAADALETTDG